tara:strand:- start:351 stop:641 length:291 start_codon:yes stop_codon:yes gene_type:complete
MIRADKVENTKDMKYIADCMEMAAILKEWHEKSSNPQVMQMIKLFNNVAIHNASLNLEVSTMKSILSEEKRLKLAYYKRGLELRDELFSFKNPTDE